VQFIDNWETRDKTNRTKTRHKRALELDLNMTIKDSGLHEQSDSGNMRAMYYIAYFPTTLNKIINATFLFLPPFFMR